VTRTERARLDDLRESVSALYAANRQRGFAAWAGRAYDYVCPSRATYPYQWFWDSCFHAIVLSHLDVGRAEAELDTLLASQAPDGFIPHMTFWTEDEPPATDQAYRVVGPSPWRSTSMQPPVLAEAVAAVASRGRGTAYLREVLPAVRRFYDWCDLARDPDRDGLIAIIEPHESGMDQTPAYDAYLGVDGDDPADFEAAWRVVAEANASAASRGDDPFAADQFVVEDLAVNVLYAENQRILSTLLAAAGDEAGARELSGRAERTTAALVARCWSAEDGEFHALAGRAEERLPGGTVAGLLPILLPDLAESAVDAIASRIGDPAQYAAPYPVPSVSLASPAFRPAPAGGTVLWRGPTWINTNWYLARGLRRHGRTGLAAAIEDASLRLVERSGFREHYNSSTGEGYGAREFSWSALVLDMVEASPSDV
jgi:glycogen debranching enzyme